MSFAYCGGLPVALEVLGSSLYERTEEEWISVLSKLKRIPNDHVQEKLRISHDGLKDDMTKDIFLDICCFFIGKDRGDVTEILNGCGLYAGIGITVLAEKSLVKIEKNNKLGMYDLIRDMGREIVLESSAKEPGKRSRLWFREDVHDVLTKNTGTETVEGLVLKVQRTNRVILSTDSFKDMKKMRLLELDRAVLTGDYRYLSKELRWVYWQGFTFNYIPDEFYQGNLVVIDVKYSSIKQVWKEAKLLDKLKILNVSYSRYLKKSPDFSKLPNLEKVIMKNCPSLSEVHPSIGDLKNILLINLKDCTDLRNLPRKIYQLKTLKTLILSGCSKIDELDEDIVQMESLTTLTAKGTSVKQVPYSILRLKSIGYIFLCGYEGLSRDVFPSLIWSWMSPTVNSLPHTSPFGGKSLSLVSLDVESNIMDYQSSMLTSLSKLRSVWVQCQSEIQLTRELRKFIDDLYDVKFNELETTSHGSQISNLSFRSLLIGMGSFQLVIDTLGKSISQGLATNCPSNFCLPDDNYPSWLAYKSEGTSVLFQVPEDSDCHMKGIILCVVYSSTIENIVAECLTNVLIINYSKCTIKIYKRDTVMSFNDEDWKGLTSNLEPGDNVEIFVAFGRGLSVKVTAAYLIYDHSVITETEPTNMNMEPSQEDKLQPSPNAKMELSPNLRRDPSQKVNKNKDIFTKLAKRTRQCLCLN
ncbi:disease resistance protein RUN1-like [Vicia villosa]|uniref:disease resistance protein RUN1-like n=1 Tax=Vicia villosa TaxID=3911 RepID=UPI00273AE7F3|nr:disease resistance protein RUN1-like [Vicia villosa]